MIGESTEPPAFLSEHTFKPDSKRYLLLGAIQGAEADRTVFANWSHRNPPVRSIAVSCTLSDCRARAVDVA